MKQFNFIITSLLVLLFYSCVQKSYKRTVVFKVDVKSLKNIKTVGLRGDNPLSWDKDYEMLIGKDSVYTVTISEETGYLFTEIKFTVNGEFELNEHPNRKVYFDTKKDTTFYQATFNVAN
jgi:putative oxidoreductase